MIILLKIVLVGLGKRKVHSTNPAMFKLRTQSYQNRKYAVPR